MKNNCFVNSVAYYIDHSPFGRAYISKYDYIWRREEGSIMLVYTACITIIISVVCVGCHALLY